MYIYIQSFYVNHTIISQHSVTITIWHAEARTFASEGRFAWIEAVVGQPVEWKFGSCGSDTQIAGHNSVLNICLFQDLFNFFYT